MARRHATWVRSTKSPASRPRLGGNLERRKFFRPLQVERLETRAMLAVAPLAVRIDAPGLSEGLDLDWGLEGKLTQDVDSNSGQIVRMTDGSLTHSGKLFTVGWGGFLNGDGSNSEAIVMAEFESDGSLSSDFNGGAPEVVNSQNPENFAGIDLVIQPNGQVLAMGSIGQDDRDIAAIYRYNDDGTRDESFADSGVAMLDLGGAAYFGGAAVLPDGSIMVSGLDLPDGRGSAGTIFLAKYDATGELDESFGDGGLAYLDSFESADPFSQIVFALPDGSILVGESAGNLLSRFSAEGVLDEDFGASVAIPGDFYSCSIRDIAVQADGKILVAGSVTYLVNGEFSTAPVLARFNPDGSSDETFGDNGTVIADLGIGGEATSIIVQPGGRIVAGGSSGPHGDQFLLRYLSDGTLDPAFGNAGLQLIDYGLNAVEVLGDLVAQPDGRTIAIGTTFGTDPDNIINRMAIARFGGTFTGYIDDFTTFVATVTDAQGTEIAYDWQLYPVLPVPGEPIDSGAGPTFSFTPDTEGLYGLDLTVTNAGHVKQNTVYLSTSSADHNLSPKNLQVALSAASVDEGDSTSISGSFQDANPDDTHHVLINWGDGETSEFDLAAGITTFSSPSHTYHDNPAAGTSYSATVTVSDQDGESTSKSAQVIVNNVAPSPHLAAALQAIDDVFIASGTISRNGRFAVVQGFSDPAAYASTTRPYQDVFVKDLQTGSLTLVSCDENGVAGNYHSFGGAISDDGRYVAFASPAGNWMDFGGVFATRIWVKDLQTGSLTLVTSGENGVADGDASPVPDISADGRYVAFVSTATNLVSDQTFGFPQIYVKDLETGTVTLASTAGLGEGGDSSEDWGAPALSADGHYVTFDSRASNLVSGDTNDRPDIFVKDLSTGAIALVSSSSSGVHGDDYSYTPSISADGRYVAFASDSSNLLAGQTMGVGNVYVKDLLSGAVTLVSTGSAGPADGYSYASALSADGRHIAFVSAATNLVSGDSNGAYDIFVKDLVTGEIMLVSSGAGGQSNGDSYIPDNSVAHSLSADGRYVLFISAATNLLPGLSGPDHLFFKDLQASAFEGAAVEGSSIHLQGSASDPSPEDTARGFSLSWSVSKNGVPGYASGNSASIDFTPNDDGTYQILLVATDQDGDSGTTTATITVTNVAPVAAISGAPQNSPEGTAISLTSASTDVSPADQAALTYTWSVTKDGAAYGTPGTAAAYSFTPNDNGSYIVTLTAHDKDGDSAWASQTIDVTNAAPTNLSISGSPPTSLEGAAVNLLASASDPSSVDEGSGFTFVWSVTKNGLDFGVGGSGANFSFIPDDDGSYIVTLVATDKDGGSAMTTLTQIVTNEAPTMLLRGNSSVNEGSQYMLGLGNLVDPGTDTVTSFSINWGDGSSDSFIGSPAAGDKFHTYVDGAAGGTSRTITLVVIDEDGTFTASSKTVTVNNVAPTASAGGPYMVPQWGDVLLMGAGSDAAGASDPVTYEWDYDYNGSTFQVDAVGISQVRSALNLGKGTVRTIALRVGDDDGGSTISTTTLTVVDPQINFSPATNLTTGTQPYAVATGDINGDYLLDMVVANYTSGTVSVFLNKSAAGATKPTFSAATSLSVGASPSSVAIGDVNADGKEDIVVTNYTAATVSVLANTTASGATTPTFAAKKAFNTGTNPVAIAFGLVSGSGYSAAQDLIIANYGSGNVSVLWNAFTGTTTPGSLPNFAAQQTFAVGSNPTSVKLAYVSYNSNYVPDLIVTNGIASGTVSVLPNNTSTRGTGIFGTKKTFNVGNTPTAVEVADINRDGKPDLLVANSNSGTISYLRNTYTVAGTPAFASQQTFAAGTNLKDVSIGDVNGDTTLDVIVAAYGDDRVSVLLNLTRDDATSAAFAAPITLATADGPRSLALADFDKDGDVEIVTANGLANNLSVLNNVGSLNTALDFLAAQSITIGASAASVAVADFNRDGAPDVVTSSNTAPATITILQNKTAVGASTLNFTSQTKSPGGNNARFVTTADINGDSWPDIVVSEYGSTDFAVFLNSTATIGGTLAFRSPQRFTTSATPASVAFGDFDNDGKLDLVIANDAYNAGLSLFLNRTTVGGATASFASPISIASGYSYPASVAAGDINGDGRIDLVVSHTPSFSYVGYQSYILTNTSTGNTPTFSAPQALPNTEGGAALMTDLNGDSKPDLVTTGHYGYIFENLTATGSATPSFAPSYNGIYMAAVASNDLNGDGSPDILQSRYNDNDVYPRLNFSVAGAPGINLRNYLDYLVRLSFPSGAIPLFGLTTGDFNRDGRADVARVSTALDISLNNSARPLPIVIQAADNATAQKVIAGVNALPVQGFPIRIELNLAAGVFTDIVASPPKGVTLVIKGVGGSQTTIVGHSPALLVEGGEVIVEDVVLTTDTDSPTAIVNEGTLTVRNSLVEESSSGAQPAILIGADSNVDLGTADEPGGNTIAIRGAGNLLESGASGIVQAVGNDFSDDGAPLTDNFSIQDAMVGASQAPGSGLVSFVPGTLFVSATAGNLQEVVNAAPAGYAVGVEAGASYGNLVLGDKPLTLAFENGPTVALVQEGGVTNLYVTGSSGPDVIGLAQGASADDVVVSLGGLPSIAVVTTGQIAVQGGAGNDAITSTVSNEVIADGGAGADAVSGASAATYVVTDTSDPPPQGTVTSVASAPPTATDDSYQVLTNGSLIVAAAGVLANDAPSVPDAALLATLVQNVAHGVLTLAADGSFNYTPAAGYFGSDGFTYRAAAADSGPSREVSVSISVVSPPTLAADQASVTADDGGPATNTGVFAAGLSGAAVTLTASAGAVAPTDVPGVWQWTLDTAGGLPVQTVTITATDALGASATTTFELLVNHAPTAQEDAFSTNQDGSLVLAGTALTANDSDIDPGVQLSVVAVSNAVNGAVALGSEGAISFTPAAGFYGVAGFDYLLSDGRLTSVGHVTITVNAAPADLIIQGTAGNDTIRVELGPSMATLKVTVNGVPSTVSKPAGAIIVWGGAGNDNLQIATGIAIPARLYGENGNDKLTASDFGSLLDGGDGNDELVGGEGPDSLDGGPGNDILRGNDGDDSLSDSSGDNEVHAGDGNDTVTLADGKNAVWTDGGADTVTAGNGANEIHAGQGANTIQVGNGNNKIWTSKGIDSIVAGNGNNEVHTGGQRDTVVLGNGNNHVWGGSDSDTITVGNGNNTIDGGSGDDTFIAGGGNNTIDGGSGNDAITVNGNGRNVISGGSGNDVVTIVGSGINSIDGGSGDDHLTGGSGNDTLNGGSGDDVLIGGSGADNIQGEAGNDLLIGGAGGDTLSGAAGKDILIGGSTTLNRAALDAVLAAWIAGTRSATISKLTVTDDGSPDTLDGGSDGDWFLDFLSFDSLTDFETKKGDKKNFD